MAKKSKAKKILTIILSITIPLTLIFIAYLCYGWYVIIDYFFIYPNSPKAVEEYLDENFVVDAEIVEELDSFTIPEEMESVNKAYLIQFKDDNNIQFIVYRGTYKRSGMSFPFFPPESRKTITDNLPIAIGNYVAKNNNYPIEDNVLNLDLCNNSDEAANIVAEYFDKVIDEWAKYYKYGTDFLRPRYFETFYLRSSKGESWFYLSNSVTKDYIKETIAEYNL